MNTDDRISTQISEAADTEIPKASDFRKQSNSVSKQSAEKRSAYAFLQDILCGILYSVAGYILEGCSLPFGSSPFGIALLCAAERHTPFVFVGLCISAIGADNAILRISVYFAILTIRLLSGFLSGTHTRKTVSQAEKDSSFFGTVDRLFGESLQLRMASACVGAFALGVYALIRGGFLYYDLYGALISLFIAPLSVSAFAGLFGNRKTSSAWRIIGYLSLFSALVYATRSLELFGISVSAFIAMLASLFAVKKEGTVKGVFTGALLGICHSPMLAPLFAFGALCGGLVFPTSITLGTVTAFTVGSAWALYTEGISALSSLMPAILVSTVLYALTDKLFLSAENTQVCTSTAASDSSVALTDKSRIDEIRLSDMQKRIRAVCDSFSELSDIFTDMGEELKKPYAEDMRRICDNAFESSCAGCSQREICRNENYKETDLQIGNLCAVLHRDGRVCERDADKSLSARCTRLPDIIDEINHNAGLHQARLLEYDKTEIYATDYECMSDILSGGIAYDGDEYDYDGELSAKLCSALSEQKISVTEAAFFGHRKKRLILRTEDIGRFDESKDSFYALLKKICNASLAENERKELDGGIWELIFSPIPALSVSYAVKTVRADGESEYCGDTAGVFYDGEDRLFAFISDGMGSGRDASLTSQICALFLKKLLSAQHSTDAALKLLNGFLRNKGNGSLHECSATVDLWELDLLCGKAAFSKSGAAPTYVLRGGSLFKIRSKTLPIGILKEPDTKRISFDIASGDVVIMVSDGVTQGKEDCPWLYDLLRSGISTFGIEKTASLVAEYAKKDGSADDLTVVILKVE